MQPSVDREKSQRDVECIARKLSVELISEVRVFGTPLPTERFRHVFDARDEVIVDESHSVTPKTSRARTGSRVIRRSVATIVAAQCNVGRILPVRRRRRNCLL